MSLLDAIFHKARLNPMRIVLCEGDDPRILEAAHKAAAEGLARISLVGDGERIARTLEHHGWNDPHIDVIDQKQSSLAPSFAQELARLRAKRGMSLQQAEAAILEPLVFAMLLLRLGHVDGSVAGAVHTTADVVRNAIQIIGMKPGTKLVSSFFIMLRDEPFHTNAHALIFADCGLVIDPDADELAEIAMAAADSATALLDTEPRVALLSFSTGGSARHGCVDKVRQAAERLRARRPGLAVDGDIQLDAAIVPQVAQSKLPGSQVAGQANVLVFPNLDAANIGYKLTERLGHATAIGPLLQGLDKPANDLSRGCNANDVYNAIAVTVVQAQGTRGQTPYGV
ncbi:phosphate acetyltransferase [Parapusillimonas sp. JC17]|uniref:phosphate acetyltransferase n=1 Tax=Parapusillimonas sp. JC17 TaxID=3445768 RepID=UPI003FA17EE3